MDPGPGLHLQEPPALHPLSLLWACGWSLPAGPHCRLPILLPMWPSVTTAGSSRTRYSLGTLWPELSLLEATKSMAGPEVCWERDGEGKTYRQRSKG